MSVGKQLVLSQGTKTAQEKACLSTATRRIQSFRCGIRLQEPIS